MNKEIFKEIGRSRNIFYMLSDEAKLKLHPQEYIHFNYEEVFVNMVNHIILQYGEEGSAWLKTMCLNHIGCLCSEAVE